MVKHRSSALLAVVCSLATLRPAATAQGATPEASPDAPERLICSVEPRPLEELLAIFFEVTDGTPVAAASPTPAVVASADGLPHGVPADDATTAAIAATIEQVFVCFQTGQYFRALALMSADLVREFGPQGGETPGDIATQYAEALAAPPQPLEAPEGEEFRPDVVLLPDGRAGFYSEDADGAHFLIFARDGGRWLWDGQIQVLAPEATPTG